MVVAHGGLARAGPVAAIQKLAARQRLAVDLSALDQEVQGVLNDRDRRHRCLCHYPALHTLDGVGGVGMLVQVVMNLCHGAQHVLVLFVHTVTRGSGSSMRMACG